MTAILDFFLSLPWWGYVLGYPAIGLLWALVYLPRSIRLQAEAYQDWRAGVIRDNGALEPLLQQRLESIKAQDKSLAGLSPDELLSEISRFTKTPIFTLFGLNLAFWPLMIPVLLLTDYLREALRLIWRGICRIGRALRWVWRRVVVAVYRWCFDQVAKVYRRIIAWANREAMADFEKLNGGAAK